MMMRCQKTVIRSHKVFFLTTSLTPPWGGCVFTTTVGVTVEKLPVMMSPDANEPQRLSRKAPPSSGLAAERSYYIGLAETVVAMVSGTVDPVCVCSNHSPRFRGIEVGRRCGAVASNRRDRLRRRHLLLDKLERKMQIEVKPMALYFERSLSKIQGECGLTVIVARLRKRRSFRGCKIAALKRIHSNPVGTR